MGEDKRLLDIDLEKLKTMMSGNGAAKLYFKLLSSNDNSKNQPYFGSDFSSLNIIPTGELRTERSVSRKQKSGMGAVILKAPVDFFWLDIEGELHEAPNAQLILYPQYPEVRFSGFLRGCDGGPNELMDPKRRGRAEGRILYFGVVRGGRVVGYIAEPESVLAQQSRELQDLPQHGLFSEVGLEVLEQDDRKILLGELKRIHQKGWITGKRLQLDATSLPCNASNCGGYTLEAELGITPNGYSEPDFCGWEVKQFGVKSFDKINSSIITLMTPEPSGGYYKEQGVEAFIRKYGYLDKKGRLDRLNFGGVHRFDQCHATTGLTLLLTGFDPVRNKIVDASGGVALIADDGTETAIWHYNKLIDHWKRKHNRAVYVPSLMQKNGDRKYSYSDEIRLGCGTDFFLLLSAFTGNKVYYDPGIKLEKASSKKPKTKRRSQFRIKSGDIKCLYRNLEVVKL